MHRLFTAAVLAVSLHAQQVTPAQLDKLYSQIDGVLVLHPGAIIADVGTGFAVDHALKMAEQVARGGKIVCVDVKQSVLTKIKDQADARHLTNVEVVLGGDDDPKLSPDVFDAILVSNTYHEFTQPAAMLKHLCDALKPGGMLVIVENCSIAHRSDGRAEQTKLHDISPELLERELAAAGLKVKERIDPILVETADRYRYLFVAEKGPPDDPGNPTVNFHGEKRSNDTHQSTTDPEARLARKSSGHESKLAYCGNVLIENRNGLVVDTALVMASGTAERDAAVEMAERIEGDKRVTVGADKGYDTRGFVRQMRERNVTPHVSENTNRSGGSALDRRTTRHAGYQLSQRQRKRIEEVFGWLKTVGMLRKTRHRGIFKVGWVFTFAAAAYNLVRMRNLAVVRSA